MVERGNLDKEKFAEEVRAYIRNRYTSDDDESTARIYKGFSSFIWGYYIIDKLIADPDISDIKIYDYNRIYFKSLESVIKQISHSVTGKIMRGLLRGAACGTM